MYIRRFNLRPSSASTDIIILWVHLSVRPSFHSPARDDLPFVRPQRRYSCNSLRISDIGLQCIGFMHSAMRQIAFKNARPILDRFMELCNFPRKVPRPCLRNDVTPFQLSAWNLAGCCIVPSSRVPFKIIMLGQYFRNQGDFEIWIRSEGWYYPSKSLRI